MKLECPAFILGNGPGLPGNLGVLSRCFTVGVNRILDTGFTPTVLLWMDGSFYREQAAQVDASEALQICSASLANRRWHIGLHSWSGQDALHHHAAPTVLCCNGNTGCCAARWALSLGCPVVYLLGMGAEYRDGRTNFYGVNPWHHRPPGAETALEVMQAERDRLWDDFGERLRLARDEADLTEIAAGEEGMDQTELRARIRQAIAPE